MTFVPLVIAESRLGSESGVEDASLWSSRTGDDEGPEMSQQMMEDLLLGAGTRLENEEFLMGISSRLQTALEKMLMAITDTTNQVQTSIAVYLQRCWTTFPYVLVSLQELSACFYI